MLDQEHRGMGENIPNPVYYLGSRRPLDPKQEMPEHVPAMLKEVGASFHYQWKIDARTTNFWPTNESQMLERVHVWQGSAYWAPCPVVAPDGLDSSGKRRSADTAGTIKEWLKIARPGHYLVVSSQPWCGEQLLAVNRAVREACASGFTFDVCGPTAPELALSKWLDHLAKQLNEEVLLLH